jgi:hypothetical protein
LCKERKLRAYFTEMREQSEELLCRKWLVVNDELAYKIAINCSSKSYPKDSEKCLRLNSKEERYRRLNV